MISETTNQAMAALPIAEADTPAFDHGETEDKPIPAPSARRISDIAAATNAPPNTAAHDTPDKDASFFPVGSAIPDCCVRVKGAVAGLAIQSSLPITSLPSLAI
jgi:hypothetical protein